MNGNGTDDAECSAKVAGTFGEWKGTKSCVNTSILLKPLWKLWCGIKFIVLRFGLQNDNLKGVLDVREIYERSELFKETVWYEEECE